MDSLSLVFTCWGLTDSIQAPFYPIEAASKSATAAQYGPVFGIIHLAIFISSPVFGHYLPRLSLRAVPLARDSSFWVRKWVQHFCHDLSTIIIIIFHHHDLKSIISFKQTRLFWRHIKTPCQLVNNASSSPTFFIIMEYVLSYHNAHLTFPLMIIIIKPRGFSRKYSVFGFKWNGFLFLWFLSWKINLYIFFLCDFSPVCVFKCVLK